MPRSSALLVFGLVAAGTISTTAIAEDVFPPDLPQECRLDNVAGAYGFNEDTLEAGARGTPLASIGLLDLRADGTAAIQEDAFAERGGEPLRGSVVEGEWTVEPNCFGFIDFPSVMLPSGERTEVDFAFIAVENASELFLIRNNPLEEADAKLLFRR